MEYISLPKDKRDLRVTFRVCKLVFSSPSYVLLLLIYLPIVMLSLVVPRNFSLIINIVLFGNISVVAKAETLIGLLPVFTGISYSISTGVLLYLTSFVIAVNLALVTYHISNHELSIEQGASSTLGTVLAVLGSGCASCGSVLLTGVLSLFGIGGILKSLPLAGGEVLLLSIAIGTLSMYWIANGLRGGMVRGCPVNP